MLQTDLDNLSEWSRKWLLCFNTDKCRVMHFGRQVISTQYSLQDHAGNVHMLQNSKMEKDLGVWMDDSLKFSDLVLLAAKKANQILGMIKGSFN